MDNCEYKKNNTIAFQIITIIISIFTGIAVGTLYYLGLIPLPLNIVKIAIIMSVYILGIILLSLFTNILADNKIYTKCICKFAKMTFVGSIGTFLSSTILAIANVRILTPIVVAFIGLDSLFFVLMLISFIGLFNCLIDRTLR